MTLTNKEINRIMKKYKSSFEALEGYDKTGKLPKKIRDELKKKLGENYEE